MATGIGAAIIGFFATTGSATAISAAAVGTLTATTAMTIASGIVGGIVVGAAVGGLGALVTGGDIGKGMLYGAIGGAVTGGISGWLSAPSSLAGGAADAALFNSGTEGGGALASGLSGSSSGIYGGAVGSATGDAVSGSLTNKIIEGGTSAAVEGAFTMGSGYLSGVAEEEAMKEQTAALTAEAQKDRDAAMALAVYNSENQYIPYNPWEEELAQRKFEFDSSMEENIRQFDKPFEEAEALRTASSNALAGMNQIRRGSTSNVDISDKSQMGAPQLDSEGNVAYSAIREAAYSGDQFLK
jgi:hypothetical protein